MKKNFMDRLFPPKYDFYHMLTNQAKVTAEGVETLARWLETPSLQNNQRLLELVDEADVVRMKMEKCLLQSFSTPFDRQDMYVFSVRLDRILELAKSTALAITAYNVKPDPMFVSMAGHLSVGVAILAQAVALLETGPGQAEDSIEKMRQANVEVGNCYRAALAQLFSEQDAMGALKRREVYNELKDAAEYMELTIDVFHKIIVRLA